MERIVLWVFWAVFSTFSDDPDAIEWMQIAGIPAKRFTDRSHWCGILTVEGQQRIGCWRRLRLKDLGTLPVTILEEPYVHFPRDPTLLQGESP